jgi:hypothetical protein
LQRGRKVMPGKDKDKGKDLIEFVEERTGYSGNSLSKDSIAHYHYITGG